jgi:hypothetical protein
VAGGSDVPFSVRPDRESAACGDVCDEVPAGRHDRTREAQDESVQNNVARMSSEADVWARW